MPPLRDMFPQLFQPQRTGAMQPNPTPTFAGWTVTREVESDGNGNAHPVIHARRSSQPEVVYRFSPNTTDAELATRLRELEAAG